VAIAQFQTLTDKLTRTTAHEWKKPDKSSVCQPLTVAMTPHAGRGILQL